MDSNFFFRTGSIPLKSALTLALILILILSSCSGPILPTDEDLQDLGLIPIETDIPTPDITFTDSEGAILKLSDFEGSVILLNFWASWCPPCRAEMPSMSTLHRELKSSDFQMLGINVGEEVNLVESFIKEFDIDFPVFYDPETKAAGEFGISALPTTLLLDRKGTVIATISGAYEWDNPDFVSMMKDWSR